ncbi:MAG: thiamine diphosphokinase [Clostridia bacterium]|nr:thiamine diphosphokinase [Clostridia bacterium]
MGKCVIIAPLYEGEEAEWLRVGSGDLTLCADGGYDAAVRHGIVPDMVIGDFDSMPADYVKECPQLILPVHKDDTDMAVCLREARERGYREFRIAGCLGGRLDHTIANLQCLYDCALRGETAWMADRWNRVTVLLPGAYTLDALPGRKLSLLAYTPEVTGVTLKGAEWTLEDATLTSRVPLGVSNEPVDPHPFLSFTSGALILCWSRDALR